MHKTKTTKRHKENNELGKNSVSYCFSAIVITKYPKHYIWLIKTQIILIPPSKPVDSLWYDKEIRKPSTTQHSQTQLWSILTQIKGGYNSTSDTHQGKKSVWVGDIIQHR